MSLNLLASFGLNSTLMDAFGFSPSIASQTFGASAYNSFVVAQAEVTNANPIVEETLAVDITEVNDADIAPDTSVVADNNSDNVAASQNSDVNQLLIEDTMQTEVAIQSADEIVVSSTDVVIDGPINSINTQEVLADPLTDINPNDVFALLAG